MARLCRPAAVPDPNLARAASCCSSTRRGHGLDSDGGGGAVDVDFLGFLSSNGLQHYVGTFTKHAIDMEALKVLEESHLAEMVRRRAPPPQPPRAHISPTCGRRRRASRSGHAKILATHGVERQRYPLIIVFMSLRC